MLTEITPSGLTIVDLVALVWFFACWFGYAYYSEQKALRKDSLSSVLHRHRINWMRQMLARENRVADASLIANLERNVSFFASSTLLILAGVLTALGSVAELHGAAQKIDWLVHGSQQSMQVKLIIYAGIFMYGFFKFTWSLRQYGFACVIVGASPVKKNFNDISDKSADADIVLADNAANIISRAAYAFNLGLRSYYFALSFLVWFVHPVFFMLVTAWVVAVLYRREFKSRVLKSMVKC
ncbi:MAG: DUF599 domain-containing protein [Pseudomonadales bacterium]|nr:DUF599 domain-containing protein [Pseudomonadales bacterium]